MTRVVEAGYCTALRLERGGGRRRRLGRSRVQLAGQRGPLSMPPPTIAAQIAICQEARSTSRWADRDQGRRRVIILRPGG
jgi:hypothetical protein